FASEAPKKLISDFEVILEQDSISENQRNVEFIIVPTRKVNRIDLYSEEENAITKLEFNGKMMPITNDPKLYRGTKNAALVSYFVSNGDSLKVKYSAPSDVSVTFKVLEYSFDLMSNPSFTMEERLDYMMPKPFVITDAIAVKRSFSVDSLTVKKVAENI